MAGGWGGAREGAGRKPAGYEAPPEKADFDRERAEHEKVKRLQREFALAKERGEYLERGAVRQAAATALAVLTQSLRSIADNVERQYSLPPDVIEGIEKEVDAALSQAAAAFKAMAPGEGPDAV